MKLKSTQYVDLDIVPVDARGNPATLDGPASWMIDNPAMASLAPSDDGLKCRVSAIGPLGTFQVSVQADGDMGPDVKSVFGIAKFEVTAGNATAIQINVGEPAEQEEPAPV